jgi:hypothetical protein
MVPAVATASRPNGDPYSYARSGEFLLVGDDFVVIAIATVVGRFSKSVEVTQGDRLRLPEIVNVRARTVTEMRIPTALMFDIPPITYEFILNISEGEDDGEGTIREFMALIEFLNSQVG